MTRLERDKVILIFKHQNLLALSKRINEGHPRRDSARNLLPYVDRLIFNLHETDRMRKDQGSYRECRTLFQSGI